MKKQLILISLLYFTGCTLIPCDSTSDLVAIDRVPSLAELAGVYYPDEQTKNLFNSFNDSSRIELNPDSSFLLHSFPERIFDYFGVSHSNVVDGRGYWNPHDSDPTAKLFISLDYEPFNENGKSDFGTSWSIYRKGEEIVLLFWVGDPDECTAVRLIK